VSRLSPDLVNGSDKLKQCAHLTPLNALQRTNRMHNMRQPLMILLAHRYQFCTSLLIMHISTFTYQFLSKPV